MTNISFSFWAIQYFSGIILYFGAFVILTQLLPYNTIVSMILLIILPLYLILLTESIQSKKEIRKKIREQK